jgi:hypothetical protein
MKIHRLPGELRLAVALFYPSAGRTTHDSFDLSVVRFHAARSRPDQRATNRLRPSLALRPTSPGRPPAVDVAKATYGL